MSEIFKNHDFHKVAELQSCFATSLRFQFDMGVKV